MKKLSLVLSLVLFSFSMLLAQRTITGTISGDDGAPLVGASVQAKGTSIGAITDIDGTYSIDVPATVQTLVVSFIGYSTQEFTLGASNVLYASLGQGVLLNETVVTAFGISKAQKSLGYSTEKIDADKLQQKAEPDVVRALANKIAGVNIIGSNGIAGSATKINIRGTNTFFGNSQPLYVVDGVPYDNKETTDGNSRLADGSGSFTSRSSDIDPNNIETMTVLKGGAAAALYGSRASNGVILITTKTGSSKKGKKGFEVSLGTSYSLEQVSGLPNYQNKYGTGSLNIAANSNGSWGAPFRTGGTVGGAPIPFGAVDSFATWTAYAALPGVPAKVPYLAQPNNVKDFFKTGLLLENTLSVSGGISDKTSITAVLSQTGQNGYIPNNEFQRYNISIGGRSQLNDKFSITGNLAYTNTNSQGPLLGGDNPSSLFARTLYMGRSWPLQSYPYSNPATNGSVFFVSSAQSDNPLWSVANNSTTSNVNRLSGSFDFNYKLTSWLTANYRIGLNTYTDNRKVTIRPGSAGAGTLGRITIDNISFKELESNFFLTSSNKITSDFEVNVTAGINYNQRTNERNATIGNQILFFGIDNINLTNSQLNGAGITPFSRRRLYGVYGDVGFGFKNALFLNVTARNDWSSTLPKDNRSYLYPSASLSWNFSESLNLENSILSYGKLRASIAKIGRDADPYGLQSVYNINPILVNPNAQAGTQFPFRSTPGASLEQTTYNPNLKPEFTTETEIGAELFFFKRRIGLDINTYNRVSTNLIAPISIPNATGYDQYYTNTGQISNKGIEIGFTLVPLNLSNGFRWETYTTFTKNVSNIDELLPEVNGKKIADTDNEIILQNTYAGSVQAVFRKGQPYGMIKGTKAARDTVTGSPTYGALLINKNTGLAIEDPNPVLLGNPAPDFILGFNNTFSYKGFSLSAVIGYSKGGKIYSSTTSFQLGRGTTADTEDRDHPFVVKGVYGDPNTFQAIKGSDGNTIENTTQVSANDLYFQSSGGSFATNAPDEYTVFDATTIRLREITLGYTLPKNFLKKTPFSAINLSINGRNLFYKAVNFPANSNFDPEISTYGTGNASGFEFSSAPSTRRYGISAKFTF